VPVLSTLKAGTQFVRDVKLRRRVQAALNGAQRPAAAAPPRIDIVGHAGTP
jgi:hypothetical protein